MLIPGFLAQYWISGTLYFIGTATAQGSVFLAGMFLANILGRATYGDYVLTYSTVITLGQLAQFGVGYMVNRYLAEYRFSAPSRARELVATLLTISVGFASVAALGLFAGGDIVAKQSLLRPDLAANFRLGAAAVGFAVMNGFFLGVLSGLQRYGALALGLVCSGVCYIGLTTLLANLFGLVGAIAGFVAAQCLQTLIFALSMADILRKPNVSSEDSSQRANYALLFRFGLPGALSGLTALPVLWLGNALIARQPNGSLDVAVYNAAFNVATLVLFLPNVLNSVGFTLVNSHRGIGDSAAYRATYLFNLAITAAVSIAGIGAVAALGSAVLTLYGPGFSGGYPILIVLLVAILPETLTVAMNQVIQSNERMWTALIAVNFPRDGSIALASLALIPTHGAIGMAYAYLVGRVIAFCSTGVLVWRLGLRL